MDLLIVVSSREAAPILEPMARACGRAGVDWGAFFTHDGVTVLGDTAIVEALQAARVSVVCGESWAQHAGGECPVRLGSQTDHSALVGEAARVVSL
jgi:hypothetical protein